MKQCVYGLYAVVLLVSLAGLVGIPACATTNPNLTPQAQVAQTAGQVVQRVGEFQQAVIDASGAGRVPVATARVIVQQTTAFFAAMAGPPLDWRTVVHNFWLQERPIIAEIPALAGWVTTFDSLIGAL